MFAWEVRVKMTFTFFFNPFTFVWTYNHVFYNKNIQWNSVHLRQAGERGKSCLWTKNYLKAIWKSNRPGNHGLCNGNSQLSQENIFNYPKDSPKWTQTMYLFENKQYEMKKWNRLGESIVKSTFSHPKKTMLKSRNTRKPWKYDIKHFLNSMCTLEVPYFPEILYLLNRNRTWKYNWL